MLFDDIMVHAAEEHPREACGLVVAAGKKHRLVKARNLHSEPTIAFRLDPDAWLAVADDEEVVGIYHSHTVGSAHASVADRSSCEMSGLPWYIVSYPAGGYAEIQPQGFRASYTKRPYVYGLHDCYGIVRDWYLWEWDIELPDYHRDALWWEKGQNMFVDLFPECGFIDITSKEMPVEVGDLFFIQMSHKVPNHAAIYIGDGKILHHAQGRLSSIDVWGGIWSKHCVYHVRHKSRMGSA